jgi:pimeloyl-ACP methyl ester carboxylesterase
MRFEESSHLETDPHLGEFMLEISRFNELRAFAAERAVSGEKYPKVWPREGEAVNAFIGVMTTLREQVREKKQSADYFILMSKVAGAYLRGGGERLTKFIYKELAELISEITSGQVDDFDSFKRCENGDEGLALLAQVGGSMELVAESNRKLQRTVFHEGKELNEQEAQEASADGAVLFICGYGASRTPYEGIFSQFRLPVIVYELPHAVVHDDPEVVKQTFDLVHRRMLDDPLLPKVTHVIGNSIGTMFASRLAVDICEQDPERNIELALVQVGASYGGALQNTHAKFADQVRERMEHKGVTFDDFSDAVKNYNPIELVAEFAKYAEENRLDLTLVAGYGDRMITPARTQINSLLNRIDSDPRMRGKHDVFGSEAAGHNSAMLFFLWLGLQKATEWSRIFKSFDLEKDSVETTRRVSKYHPRRTRRQDAK